MGGGKTSIYLATVSVFARMMGKDNYFCDVSQHVVSEAVATASWIPTHQLSFLTPLPMWVSTLILCEIINYFS